MVAVIGDVHGCYYTLDTLYKKIKDKYPDIPVYCVGDLVDRGKYSCQTVEYVLENNIQFVLGNHDLMFYYYYKVPDLSLIHISEHTRPY
jgi:serine/threonine protein phosphatase 1